jgi:hypothetical protein
MSRKPPARTHLYSCDVLHGTYQSHRLCIMINQCKWLARAVAIVNGRATHVTKTSLKDAAGRS